MAALLGVCIAFEMPAISALVPELVRHEQIAAAIALDRSVFHGSRLIGPSVAGLMVSTWGAATAFFANALPSSLSSSRSFRFQPREAGAKEEEEQRRSGIMDGFRYVKSDRIMVLMIALIALTTIFVFPVISVMLPLYVRNVLHLGPDRTRIANGGVGTGSLAGSLGFISRRARASLSIDDRNAYRDRRCAILHGALEQFSADRGMRWAFSPSGFRMNSVSPTRSCRNARRRRCAAASRLYFGLSFFGLMPIAGLGVPGLSDLIGMRTALGIASVIYGIGAFFVLSAAGRKVCECPVTRQRAIRGANRSRSLIP